MRILNERTAATAAYFLRTYPRRTAVLVGLLILSGLAEGVGLVTLLPLLELGTGGGAAAESDIGRAVAGLLGSLGISLTFGVLLALIVLAMVLKAAFLWLAAQRVGYTVADVATQLRLSLIRSLMAARWDYFIRQPVGHLANAIGTEATRASQTYRASVAILSGLIQALIYLGVAMLVSWWVALLTILAGVLMLFGLSKFIRMSRSAGDRQTELTRSLTGRLIEGLRGIKPIKAMAREEYVWPLLESETHDLNDANRRQVLAVETLRLFQEPLTVLIIAGGVWTVIVIGSLELPSVLVLAFLFYRLMGRIQYVQSEYASMVSGESALVSLRESVDGAVAARDHADRGKLHARFDHLLSLRDVTFGYDAEPVLRNISLDLPAGGFVAITGASGAGKTTLIDLIIGLHRPWSGRITADGDSVHELDSKAWRRMIGYVPQETFLFHDTILCNITLGDAGISREAVERALEAADALEFVASMPEGLDTTIGEQGSRLSGGQRQRIALARALVGGARLLILDEATSALDPETEESICRTLNRLKGGTTILSISHQPALVEAADRVCRLENGRLEWVAGRAAPLGTAVG